MKKSTEKNSYCFLLGGYDLEMKTIRSILENQGFKEGVSFYDRNLSWGANWEDYKEEIKSIDQAKFQFVGIELSGDIPDRAMLIDHHNERSAKKSSIEQLADLLNIELTWEQKLIAANDKGYIPAMLQIGASKKEIENIRKKDREAQGVSLEDEKSAIESLKNKSWNGDILIVKSKSDKFSPIVDAIYQESNKILVYKSTELTYYGVGISQLASEFHKLVKEGTAYYGGDGDKGFFGIVKDKMQVEALIELKNKIENMMKKPFSKHIFLFPFNWKTKSSGCFSETVDTEKITDIFNDSTKWNAYQFKKDLKAEEYNESTYFHSAVQKALYDFGQEDDLLSHFEYDVDTNSTYDIKIKGKKKDDTTGYEDSLTLSLDIADIMVNIYSTGIGVLSFHLENNVQSQSDFNSILKINEYGRRIYPQFLGQKEGIVATQKAFLPEKIKIKIGTTIISDGLEGKYLNKNEYPFPPKISNILLSLLPDSIGMEENDTIQIEPTLDDRMFVICWYGNDNLIQTLKKYNKEVFDYQKSDDWYKYLFVDEGYLSIRNKVMQKEQLLKHTYARWVDDNQLFGISRYSFVVLTKQDGWLIPDHVSSMYYKMIELSLVQRASALRFAEEAANISKLDGETRAINHKVSILFKAYIEFQNRIYFREVTPHEQGIELYDMMQNFLRTERDVKELDKEIEELHNYASFVEERLKSDRADIFALLATIFIPASLIIGFFGMSTMPDKFDGMLSDTFVPFWQSILISVALTISGAFILKIFLGGKKTLKERVGLTVLILFFIFLFLYLYFNRHF